MTTIATDGRTMAGDSLVTSGGEMVRIAPKVFRTTDGRIFGSCGSSFDAIKFERWMLEGGDSPTLGDDWCALVLNPDGSVDYVEKSLIPLRYLCPQAIGSGSSYAIGAMLAGASPEAAVDIAISRDRVSGGPVTTISLELREVA